MNNCYMVEFELPAMMGTDFLEKIQQQRAFVENLIKQGVVRSYSLSQNRSRLWMVLSTATEFEAMSIIGKLPLSRFMIPSISTLMFHDTAEETYQKAVASSLA